MDTLGRQQPEAQLLPGWFPFVLIAVVCVLFVILGLANLSNTEVVLLGVLQTIFSLAAGWLVTHAYAKSSEDRAVRNVEELHQKNLRIFALKAAEKVENLSRELNRLAIYLSQELEEEDYESSVEELLAKEERIESAIHLINTLKSVNDTSLSDWRGVIGDEIDEIRQRADQREETLEKLVDKIHSIQEADEVRGVDVETSKSLFREISKLRRDLNFVAGGVVGNLWTARKATPASNSRQTFHSKCPVCGGGLTVRQRSRVGDKKALKCSSCESRLVSEVNDHGSIDVSLRKSVQESVECQSCGTMNSFQLDELVGANAPMACSACSAINNVARTKGGVVSAVSVKQGRVLDEGLIEDIRRALPQQPWPKGIHASVGNSLGIDPSLVRKAISQLILRGVFMDQFQGVLCTPGEKLLLMRSLGKEIQ